MNDCTLVTCCYDTSDFNTKPISLVEGINKMDVILRLPIYLVIYTDDKYYEMIKNRRSLYDMDSKTVIIKNKLTDLWSFQYLNQVKENRLTYFPTKDERTSAESHLVTCNKFDFVLNVIELNPFNSNKFGWIDAFLGVNGKMRIYEDYSDNNFLSLLNNITDKFHIQILNVNDKKYKLEEHKREYYQTYRYVVCGGLFTCGKDVGIKILTRLKEIFVITTNLGYGHGEEMLYLEILDEFYDDINKSYGDYGQMGDNFIMTQRNIDYINHLIIKRYLNFGYNRECYDCCHYVLNAIENHNVPVSMGTYIDILFSYYVSSFFYKKERTLSIVAHINDVCYRNKEAKQVFDQNKEFYQYQLSLANSLKPKYKLIVTIFACATIKKYKDELLKINDTWGKRAEEKGVKVLYFLGEEQTDLTDDKYIYLKNVKNDYSSASYKQNLGLKYTYEHYDPSYVFVCGSDTYVNIDKLLLYLDSFPSGKELYIGGHGDYRRVGLDNIYFHSGGAGFILSKNILSYLYPFLSSMQEEWEKLCIINHVDYLKVACDVMIAYYVKHFEIITSNGFISCNYKGYANHNTYPCCVNKFKIDDIMTCHHMTLTDCDEYTTLLEQNNYYI